MSPYSLYGGTPPHVKGDDTSTEAAIRALPFSESLRARVFRFIARKRNVGATDDEIEEASGLTHQTISARRRELVLLGVIHDSGERRLTRSGRKAKVWMVNSKGSRVAASSAPRSSAANTPS